MLGIEALDGLEHAELGDLYEVIEGLAAAIEPAGAAQSDPAVLLYQLVTQSAVTGAPVLAEALLDGLVVSRHVS